MPDRNLDPSRRALYLSRIMGKKRSAAIEELLEVMARLRAPGGCPWDRKQTHQSLRFYAVEEVYELLDAIESGDDTALLEELGDVLLQVVFHAQLARERGAFDFDAVARRLTEKLIHRHPHVFGNTRVRDADQVLAQWDELKRKEKHGTEQERSSVFDGIPRHLPALLRATELVKKARRAGLHDGMLPSREPGGPGRTGARWTPRRLAVALWELVEIAQARGWSAEALLREETKRREQAWRQVEHRRSTRRRSPSGKQKAAAARQKGPRAVESGPSKRSTS